MAHRPPSAVNYASVAAAPRGPPPNQASAQGRAPPPNQTPAPQQAGQQDLRSGLSLPTKDSRLKTTVSGLVG